MVTVFEDLSKSPISRFAPIILLSIDSPKSRLSEYINMHSKYLVVRYKGTIISVRGWYESGVKTYMRPMVDNHYGVEYHFGEPLFNCDW